MTPFFCPSKQNPIKVTTLTWEVLLILTTSLINSSPFPFDEFSSFTATGQPVSSFPLYTLPKSPCPNLILKELVIFLTSENLYLFRARAQWFSKIDSISSFLLIVNQNFTCRVGLYLLQQITMHIMNPPITTTLATAVNRCGKLRMWKTKNR